MDRRGAALIFIFIILVSLSGVALAFLTLTSDEIKASGAGLKNIQAYYIAEAGLAKARWALTEDGQSAGWGEEDISFGEGTYTVTTTDNGDDTYTITSDGYIPDDTDPLAKRRVIEKNIPVSAGSPNLSLGATASASSVQAGNTADKAIDGDVATKWKSNVKNGSWLKLDFGSSTTFNKIVVIGNKIDSYVIEYSSDDINYNSVTNLVEAPAWTFIFDLVSARYSGFSVNGNRPEIDELETYNTASESLSLGRGEFVTSW